MDIINLPVKFKFGSVEQFRQAEKEPNALYAVEHPNHNISYYLGEHLLGGLDLSKDYETEEVVPLVWITKNDYDDLTPEQKSLFDNCGLFVYEPRE